MSGPHILVVDDEADIRGLLKEILSEEGYEVDVAANAVQARASRARQSPDLVLLDIWMPDVDGISLLREWSASTTDGCPVVMMSGHGTVETAVEATRLGAFDFVEKPLSLAKLLRTVERALDAGKRRRGSGKMFAPQLLAPIGKSKIMQQLRAELQQIAGNPSSVLLIGEPGSGREAFARYLHERSPRAASPFVTLVASSLREADAENRLFGREEAGGGGRSVGRSRRRHTLHTRDRGSAARRAATPRRSARVGPFQRVSAAPSRSSFAAVCCHPRSPESRIAPVPKDSAATCSRISTC